jgi:hypothetical protein
MDLGHAKLGAHQVQEEPTSNDENPIDPDPDSDLDETKPQQGVGGRRITADVRPLTGIL